ncbi:cation:proton antiporter [Caballeronia sordidicola]|nr:sodium:proton antiporter [Caballeronia sordidicola]
MIDALAILVVAAAMFAYINERLVRLPMTIGVAAIALTFSLICISLESLDIVSFRAPITRWISSLDFSRLLLNGMLSFLLFAGALQVDGGKLKQYGWQVGFLAIVSTATSAVLIGVATYLTLNAVHLNLPFTYCLVFGSVVAPTDAVSVLGTLRRATVPSNVETAIAGESLFNDGVGIVLFAIFAQLAVSDKVPSITSVAGQFCHEAIGGIFLGGLIGMLILILLRGIDHYQVEVLLTVAAVIGGYAVAEYLGVSGPLAMVVAGALVGNIGREHAMSHVTRANLDTFWELIDGTLNAVLFTLIGLEAVAMRADLRAWMVMPATIAIVLSARVLTVGLPVALMSQVFKLPARTAPLMVWAGLRGGISVALALSLPAGRERDLILLLTYGNVIFSTFAQGLSIEWFARRTYAQAE